MVLLAMRASIARADEAPKSGAHDESVRDTARDVAHDTSGRARADLPARQADGDTADGRIDGDVGIVVGVGATFNSQATRGAAELRVRYLDTAGVFFTYEDALGFTSADPSRVVATGLEVKPLFLGRWVTGNELGLRWTDLLIDSFGLELGAFLEQPPRASFGSRSGLQMGIGLEVPLLARASGPWVDIHGGARWSDAVLAGAPSYGPSDRALYLTVTVAYHQLFATHVVDVNDAAPR
jgi:hypothetical protein